VGRGNASSLKDEIEGKPPADTVPTKAPEGSALCLSGVMFRDRGVLLLSTTTQSCSVDHATHAFSCYQAWT